MEQHPVSPAQELTGLGIIQRLIAAIGEPEAPNTAPQPIVIVFGEEAFVADLTKITTPPDEALGTLAVRGLFIDYDGVRPALLTISTSDYATPVSLEQLTYPPDTEDHSA